MTTTPENCHTTDACGARRHPASSRVIDCIGRAPGRFSSVVGLVLSGRFPVSTDIAGGSDGKDGPVRRYGRKLSNALYRKYFQALRFHYRHVTARRRGPPGAPIRTAGILIISLPRSGSSWVGSILGAAGNAIYLREPLNQNHLAAGGTGTVFEIDAQAPPPAYAAAASAAFRAMPAFDAGIAPHPRQWTPGHRARGRVVVKEVNPFICDWLARTYRPRMVLLLRHPAAIAQSYHRLGWDLAYAPLGIDPREPFWRRHGDFQARALRRVLAFSQRYDDITIAHYEDICADPVVRFRALFDHCGLDWSADVERRIVRQSSRHDGSSSYATARISRQAADAWRRALSPAQLAEVRRGYARQPLPWYQAEADWTLDVRS